MANAAAELSALEKLAISALDRIGMDDRHTPLVSKPSKKPVATPFHTPPATLLPEDCSASSDLNPVASTSTLSLENRSHSCPAPIPQSTVRTLAELDRSCSILYAPRQSNNTTKSSAAVERGTATLKRHVNAMRAATRMRGLAVKPNKSMDHETSL